MVAVTLLILDTTDSGPETVNKFEPIDDDNLPF